MTSSPTLKGRDIGAAQRATSAVLDVLLTEIGTTFDRWIVLSGLATDSFPAEVGLLVPALAGALGTTRDTVEWMLDEAESGEHIHVVSAGDGDPRTARVELTAQGLVLYERLRAAVDELTAELQTDIPREDLVTARRVLVEITARARDWLGDDDSAAVPARSHR